MLWREAGLDGVDGVNQSTLRRWRDRPRRWRDRWWVEHREEPGIASPG